MTQNYKPKNFQREVNRIISSGVNIRSMVYRVGIRIYEIHLEDDSISVTDTASVKHFYITHPTYTGPGCAICGGAEYLHPSKES